MEKAKRTRRKVLSATQYFLKHRRTLVDSFNWAIEGIVFSLKTQRNMKIHFVIAGLVLLLSLVFNLNKFELIAVLFAITLVIVAELLNTAVEVAVDLATDGEEYELAKIAKDVAAGAVLIAALNSVFIAFLVFFKKVNPLTFTLIRVLGTAPEYLTGIAVIIVFGATIFLKILLKEKTPARGGWPSVHSAIAGSLFTSITILSRNLLVGSLSFFLALLVLQSRVEKAIHTTFEVVSGFLIGMFLTLFLFQLFYF
ncbi:MAG: diacylglycerol kinase [Actinobacteria bacterium]|nr:diacylglycerol kinase [Actinomycetota bacterium]